MAQSTRPLESRPRHLESAGCELELGVQPRIDVLRNQVEMQQFVDCRIWRWNFGIVPSVVMAENGVCRGSLSHWLSSQRTRASRRWRI